MVERQINLLSIFLSLCPQSCQKTGQTRGRLYWRAWCSSWSTWALRWSSSPRARSCPPLPSRGLLPRWGRHGQQLPYLCSEVTGQINGDLVCSVRARPVIQHKSRCLHRGIWAVCAYKWLMWSLYLKQTRPTHIKKLELKSSYAVSYRMLLWCAVHTFYRSFHRPFLDPQNPTVSTQICLPSSVLWPSETVPFREGSAGHLHIECL